MWLYHSRIFLKEVYVKRSRAQWIVGLIGASLGAGFALTLAACPDPLADCVNTATCPPPDCGDAGRTEDGNCIDSGSGSED